MSVCARLSTQIDLNVMLYLYDLYNIGRISIYVIKSSGQNIKPSRYCNKEGCVINTKEEYINHEGGFGYTELFR